MKKRVFLLAVSCKNGGLCPGGIDMDNPKEWIRIVRNDGKSGAVQGFEIDFAKPLDIIEFDGHSVPQGVQKENWVIDNMSCKKVGTESIAKVKEVYAVYGYHGYWNNWRPYLSEEEFQNISQPSETLLSVTDVRIYKNDLGKAKIDFSWTGSRFPIKGVSLTDQDFYSDIDEGNAVCYNQAIIVISIPRYADWTHPDTGEKRAYKFVSKVFQI